MLFTLCQLNPTVGDLKNNSKKIIEAIETAKSQRSDLVITSELALTGYPPLDLLFEKKFINEVEQTLMHIIPHTKGITALIGLPRKNLSLKEKFLFNSTAILQDGNLLGFYDKKLLPTYDIFDEKRYFEEGKKSCILNIKGKKVGLSICEDVWSNPLFVKETLYSTNPLQAYENKSIDLLVNQASSPYHFGKSQLREKLMHEISSKLKCKVVFLNQVGANDGLLFDGNSFICDEKQNIAYKSMCFEEDVKTFCIDELNPTKNELDVIEELYLGLKRGIKDYFHKQGFKKCLIGLSGGIDSALVAYIAVAALGKENVKTLFLPSRYSSQNSLEDAKKVARILDTSFEVLSIEKPFEDFLELLKNKSSDIVEQNLQARIRAIFLMAYSNFDSSLVLNTSNKSELAMGYSTLYGDSIGALSPLGDLYKTQVFTLAKFLKIPESIQKKEPSAELKANQKDSDTLPPYEILDPILIDFIEENLDEKILAKKHGQPIEFIRKIIKTVFANEYKRKQSPLILRVSKKALTPLVGRIVPTVAKFY